VKWDPDSSRNRIREAVKSRPDWCLSRQRSWGVGIPAVYCETCAAPTLDDRILKRAAELVRAADSDTWYERPVEDFLPKDFACPACGSKGPFRKEEDVLDVWFDSGATHRAVQVSHPELAPVWRAAKDGQAEVVYFEGPDQHRGWFNSSLMVGVGVEDRAPFTQVATHGWVLDGSGRAMHKSLGNVINPQTLVDKYGADVVRWWALATDWRNDVRVGDEILQRVADAYRKVRNTLRFLLGNLNDFTPAHAVPQAKLMKTDRAFADHLTARLARVRAEWTALQFHRALDQVLDLCTVDLSAVFLDVAKDRLYTLMPDDPARRSAQTALWQALHDLTLAVSPALVFTADEAWRSHPALVAECESVHFAEWPRLEEAGRTSDEWLFLREVRDTVNAAIEPLRATKTLATTAEADVTLAAPRAWIERLEPYGAELVALLIVAELTLETLPDGAAPRVDVRKTTRAKCDRCWMYRTDVGHDASQPGLCARCTSALAARA
jgi:isoleucyl-tRNA synthetase